MKSLPASFGPAVDEIARMKGPAAVLDFLRLMGMLIALSCALGGCAVLAPRPLPPTVSLEALSIVKFDFLRPIVKVTLRTQNPNSYDLVLRDIRFSVAANDIALLQGVLVAEQTVPALGNAAIDIDVGTDTVSLMAVLASVAAAPTLPVRYHVTGEAVVQDGIKVPFNRRGEVNFASRRPRS